MNKRSEEQIIFKLMNIDSDKQNMCRIFVFIETSQHADRCSLFVQQFRSTNKKGENDENKHKNKIKNHKASVQCCV